MYADSLFVSLLLLLFQPHHELPFWCVRFFGNRAAFGLQEEEGRLFIGLSFEGFKVARTLGNDKIGALKKRIQFCPRVMGDKNAPPHTV